MSKEAFKKLSDYFLDIIECESSVHVLPDTIKVFINEKHKSFEQMRTEFPLFYYEVELYITTIFNKFINEKIADKNYSLLNISKDSLYDVLLLMKNAVQETIAAEQQIKDEEVIKSIPFVIENEIRIIISVFVQKLETFKQSILYVQRSLEEKNIANSKDIEDCKKEVEGCKKDIESTKLDIVNTKTSINVALSNSKKQFDEDIKRSERRVHETSITVLGIFSAIVLTFNTIIGLFASTMQSLAASNAYKFILILLLIGLLTTNILYGLYCFLRRVYMGKNEPNTEDIKDTMTNSGRFFESVKHNLPFIISNIIIIASIVCVLFAWTIGAIENRNYEVSKRICSKTASSQEEAAKENFLLESESIKNSEDDFNETIPEKTN